MKNILTLGIKAFVFLSVLVSSSQVFAIDRQNPYLMVKEVGTKTFDRIKNEKQLIKDNPEVLREIMETELMPYIDYKFSAFKVLGKYTRELSREELQEFVAVFREYLITSYAVAMGYYDDQLVEFAPEVDFSGRSDVTVRAVIKDDTSPDIKVAFKVRKGRKSNQWEAYDMIAEGISLISSKRSEFESILRTDGVDKVIAQMRRSIQQPIVLNK